jgi:hypothetical protein
LVFIAAVLYAILWRFLWFILRFLTRLNCGLIFSADENKGPVSKNVSEGINVPASRFTVTLDSEQTIFQNLSLLLGDYVRKIILVILLHVKGQR